MFDATQQQCELMLLDRVCSAKLFILWQHVASKQQPGNSLYSIRVQWVEVAHSEMLREALQGRQEGKGHGAVHAATVSALSAKTLCMPS